MLQRGTAEGTEVRALGLAIDVAAGSGEGPTALAAFDAALRAAGIANFNLVRLSSVIPPGALVEVHDGPVPPIAGGWGDRLYVVMAEMRVTEPGDEAWAGIGWVQDGTGKGLFVEHEGHSRDEVTADIEASLASLCAGRPEPFGPVQMKVHGVRCADAPVCSVVIASYQAEPWTHEVIDLEAASVATLPLDLTTTTALGDDTPRSGTASAPKGTGNGTGTGGNGTGGNGTGNGTVGNGTGGNGNGNGTGHARAGNGAGQTTATLTAPAQPRRHEAARPQAGTPTLAPDFAAFSPDAYLAEYYAHVGPENQRLLEFLAAAYAEVPPGASMLELGIGPTIYQLIAAAERVGFIDVADPLPENLGTVDAWRSGAPEAFDWGPFVRAALFIEGRDLHDEGRGRAERIRSRMRHLLPCDVSNPDPLLGAGRPYDVVGSHFVAESITDDRGAWRRSLGNIASLVAPGGRLVLSALEGAGHWKVGDRAFPAVPLTVDDVVEALLELGFSPSIVDRTDAEVLDLTDAASPGYTGLIFVAARKGHPRRPTPPRAG